MDLFYTVHFFADRLLRLSPSARIARRAGVAARRPRAVRVATRDLRLSPSVLSSSVSQASVSPDRRPITAPSIASAAAAGDQVPSVPRADSNSATVSRGIGRRGALPGRSTATRGRHRRRRSNLM